MFPVFPVAFQQKMLSISGAVQGTPLLYFLLFLKGLQERPHFILSTWKLPSFLCDFSNEEQLPTYPQVGGRAL